MAISPILIARTTSPAAPAKPAAAAAASQSSASPVDAAVISSSASAAPTAPASSLAGTLDGAAALGIGSALKGIGGAIAHAVGNTLAGAKFIGYGSIYLLEKRLTENREAKYSPCDNLPTPTLDRPFVLVPGWTTEPDAFGPLVGLLTRNGANGGQPYFVKQGQIHEMDADGQLQPLKTTPAQGRVFEIVWSDTHQSPDKNVVEMDQNMEAICKATGFDKVDAEGYSMGGLDTRLYVDQGGTRVNRFMMLGTPNRGTRFGDLVIDVLDRKVDWAAKFGGVSGGDRESMDWLRAEANSPKLQDLNSRWAQQQKAVPTLTVGTDIMPTAGRSWFTMGDGLVPRSSLELPNSNTIVLHDAMQHGRLNDDETVQHIRSIFFGWGLPLNATDVWPDDAEIIAQVPTPPRPSATPAP